MPAESAPFCPKCGSASVNVTMQATVLLRREYAVEGTARTRESVIDGSTKPTTVDHVKCRTCGKVSPGAELKVKIV